MAKIKKNKMKNIITYTQDRVGLWNSMGMIALQKVPRRYLEVQALEVVFGDRLLEFAQWAYESYASYLQVQFYTQCDTYQIDIEDYYNTVKEIQDIFDNFCQKSKNFRYFSIYQQLMYIFEKVTQKQTKNVVADN